MVMGGGRKEKKNYNFFLAGQEMIFVPSAEALLGPGRLGLPPGHLGTERAETKEAVGISSSYTKLFMAGKGH